MSSREVPVRLRLSGEADGLGVATVEDWEPIARIKRAVGPMCICWAAAGVSLFIPIVHFFLVPALLAAGPLFFALRISETSTLQALSGDCPRCKKPGQFVGGGRFKLPRNVTCDGCGNLLELGGPADARG